MNSKNIKKFLHAKIEDWIKYVDDSSVKTVIKENAIITGGAIVSLLTGDEVKDYDVYFKTKEACQKVAEYYVNKFNDTHKTKAEVRINDDGRVTVFIKSKGIATEVEEQEENIITDETESYVEERQEESKNLKPKYRPVFMSTNAISLSDKIQIVIRFYGEVDEIHTNYDFVHCTCSYSFYDKKLELPVKALEAIINKELFYCGSKYPLCSIIRTRKFINRGWTINAGQYLKMALQLNELDLKDLEVFQDQLAGVDSAYFDQAIRTIKEKQSTDESFKIDNTYLFEVINRIF